MEKLLDALKKPQGVQFLVLILVSTYWALRMYGFSGLSGDEAEQVLFAQSFQWGYDVANPPLYTWILITLFSIFGKSAAVVVGLKLSVLASLYFAMYHAGRLALGGERRLDWSLVALSPVLILFVSWQAIFSYSHSLLNALFVILTFITALKLIETKRTFWYLIFGVAIGLGMQTKYSYGMFVLALLGAALTIPSLRRNFLDRRMGLCLITALGTFAPHGIWLIASASDLQGAIAYKLETGTDMSYAQGLAKGLLALLKAAFAFLSPLWLVLLLVFPALLRRRISIPSEPLQISSLLGRTFIGVVLMMLAMVLSGATQFRPNYLFLLILVPIWAFARLPIEEVPGKRRRVYAALVILGLVLSVGGLTAKAIGDPLKCKKCQMLMPYEEIAAELKAHGFKGGSVLAHWYPNPLPGNLLLHLDNTRMISTKFPTLRPPQISTDGQCLLVTFTTSQGGVSIHDMFSSAKLSYGVPRMAQPSKGQISVPYTHKPDKSVLIDYVLIEQGAADCR